MNVFVPEKVFLVCMCVSECALRKCLYCKGADSKYVRYKANRTHMEEKCTFCTVPEMSFVQKPICTIIRIWKNKVQIQFLTASWELTHLLMLTWKIKSVIFGTNFFEKLIGLSYLLWCVYYQSATYIRKNVIHPFTTWCVQIYKSDSKM